MEQPRKGPDSASIEPDMLAISSSCSMAASRALDKIGDSIRPAVSRPACSLFGPFSSTTLPRIWLSTLLNGFNEFVCDSALSDSILGVAGNCMPVRLDVGALLPLLSVDTLPWLPILWDYCRGQRVQTSPQTLRTESQILSQYMDTMFTQNWLLTSLWMLWCCFSTTSLIRSTVRWLKIMIGSLVVEKSLAVRDLLTETGKKMSHCALQVSARSKCLFRMTDQSAQGTWLELCSSSCPVQFCREYCWGTCLLAFVCIWLLARKELQTHASRFAEHLPSVRLGQTQCLLQAYDQHVANLAHVICQQWLRPLGYNRLLDSVASTLLPRWLGGYRWKEKCRTQMGNPSYRTPLDRELSGWWISSLPVTLETRLWSVPLMGEAQYAAKDGSCIQGFYARHC